MNTRGQQFFPPGCAGSAGLALTALWAELCWVYPWTLWLGVMLYGERLASPPLSLSAALLLGSGGLLLNRALSMRQRSLAARRAVVLASGLLLALLAVRYGVIPISRQIGETPALLKLADPGHPQFFALFAAVFFWWRGLVNGRPDLHVDDYRVFFPRGFLALILLAVLLKAQAASPFFTALLPLQSSLGGYLTGFFVTILLTLGISHLHAISADHRKRTLLFRRWAAVLFCSTALVALTAVSLAGFIPFNRWQTVIKILKAPSDYIGNMLLYLLTPLDKIAAWLIRILQARIEKLPLPAVSPFQELDWGAIDLEQTATIIFPGLSAIIQWVLLAAAAALFVYLLFRSVFKVDAGRKNQGPEELHEQMFSWALLRGDLKALLALGKQPFKLPGRPRRRFKPGKLRRTRDLSNIRAIYRAFLSRAARFGRARYLWETPYEFRQRLESELPGAGEPLQALTEYYVAERYGSKPLSPGQVAEAKVLWKKIDTFIGPNN